MDAITMYASISERIKASLYEARYISDVVLYLIILRMSLSLFLSPNENRAVFIEHVLTY